MNGQADNNEGPLRKCTELTAMVIKAWQIGLEQLTIKEGFVETQSKRRLSELLKTFARTMLHTNPAPTV